MVAEITKEQQMASAIQNVILVKNYHTVLEIGSKDGDGSTQVFIEALKKVADYNKNFVLRDSIMMYCVETDNGAFCNLVRNTAKYPWVVCCNGSSINIADFLPKDFDNDVWNSPFNGLSKQYSREEVLGWYQRDVAGLPKIHEEAFISNSSKQRHFDVVLLDGGEFNGYSEYVLLKDKVNCFILDDTVKAFKNNQVYHELLEDTKWTCYAKNDNERNGWAIFVRVGE